MATIAEALNLALQYHQDGRLQEAEALYRQILQVQPDHPDALHLLGMIAHQGGQHQVAVEYIRRAIVLNPHAAEFQSSLGMVYRALGKLEEAVASYRQALTLKPEFADAYSNLGNVFRDQGKLEEAVAQYRRALALKPDLADAHSNLGNVFRDQGKLEEAVAQYRRALALKPDLADAHSNLGLALQAQGKLEEAEAHYRQALTLKPDDADAHYNIGFALQAQSRLEEAVAQYRRALVLKPDLADAHNNLGLALHAQGKLAEAAVAYRKALAFKPDYAEAHNNLGLALHAQGKLTEAAVAYRKALALKPDYIGAHNNLGNALKDQGKLEEAVACYEQVLALAPDSAGAHSNLVFVRSYNHTSTVGTIAVAYREWNDRHARPLALHVRPHTNDRSPERRLRVGYVSGDFRTHPISFFVEPLLFSHDHAGVEVFCYSNGPGADATTRRLESVTDAWRNIAGLTDEAVAERVVADGIDILIDLSGHTARNRLLVFARKPAPVQVTYLGSLTTTGLATMDYRLTDRFLSPTNGPEWSSEELIRLPTCFACYQAPAESPAITPLPATSNGYVTFGSLNNLVKMPPTVINLWSKILQLVPESRLILKDKTLADPAQRVRYLGLFTSNGIEPERIELLQGTSNIEHMAAYGRVDIGLDPFPYTGCLTTCEALWMGVPVVTLAGVMAYSRAGVSLLSNLDLEGLVAATPEAYVEIAVESAKKTRHLAVLRSKLRARMAASALCDAKTFAREVEKVYRRMW
ncbi:MAG: tetratricopeptide repeat protein, partial [Planctomycetota bacterium]